MIEKLLSRRRYGILLKSVRDRFARFGFDIQPFYVILEGVTPTSSPGADDFSDFTVERLTNHDLDILISLPERAGPPEVLRARLNEGNLCFALKRRNDLIAYTWCDLKKCKAEGYTLFTLDKNEAYLFDAYTLQAWRGKNIAAYLRCQCYKELRKMGKNRFYSVSAAFNTPALKFKQKLGAKKLQLNLVVRIFNNWSFRLKLKDYESAS